MSYFDVTNLVADTRRPEDIVPSVVFFGYVLTYVLSQGQ